MRMSQLSDQQLFEIYEQNRLSESILQALNEELKTRDSDAALDLHVEVARARRALARMAAVNRDAAAHAPAGPVRGWLRDFFAARAMARPDGRPLFRYRMTDAEFDRANDVVLGLAGAGRLAEPDERAGALFVAWIAEWFRRDCATTHLRWDDPAPALLSPIPYPSKQKLTDCGLRYWGRGLRHSAYAREFLLTLALEGGFPVRILADGARGWLKDYLRAVLRRAVLSDAEGAAAVEPIAREESGRMRSSFRHDDFVALCAELVADLLALRRRAASEGRAAPLRNSIRLDAICPGWRDELPIYVPQDEALVAGLLNGLIDEDVAALTTEGVEARRYLVKRRDGWRAALQITADGETPPNRLPTLTGRARVRAVASGELSRRLTGEIALFEPPAGDRRRWRVRPSTRMGRLLDDFPFAAPASVLLTAPDSPPQPWIWPGGEPRRSDLLVFAVDDGATAQEPLLRFLKAGSTRSPARTLYALTPCDWEIEAAAEGAIVSVEEAPALGRKLARLEGAARLRSPGGDAPWFRVEPNAEGRDGELDLDSPIEPGFALADDARELVASGAAPRIREGARQPRSAGRGELFVRRPGERWAELAGPLRGAGLVDLSWRDPVADIQIEKRRLVLAPRGARVSGLMRDASTGELRLDGLPGWTAASATPGCRLEAVDPELYAVRFDARPAYRLRLWLRPPEGEGFEAIVPMRGRDAVVALADGSILSSGRRIDVGALRGAVAVAPVRSALRVVARGARTGGMQFAVDGELALGALRGVIDETLASLPGQDDLVELEFVGDWRSPIRVSRYRHDPLRVDGDLVRRPASASADRPAPVARMICEPRREHALEPVDAVSWRIPERCTGPCLVYLRDGADVVSRPAPALRPGPRGGEGALTAALAIEDYLERQAAIEAALAGVARGASDPADLDWLRDAAAHLNGLPASAFDALRLAAARPGALVHLLLAARDAEERSAVWSLQNELPFLWLALPLRAWLWGVERRAALLEQALQALGAETARRIAVDEVRRAQADIAGLEPALDAVFVFAGLPSLADSEAPSLAGLTDAYVRNRQGREDEAPNDLAARLAAGGLPLPPEIAAKSHEQFAGLVAPVLLAASASGRFTLDAELALIARRALREDPAYVSAAWRRLVPTFHPV